MEAASSLPPSQNLATRYYPEQLNSVHALTPYSCNVPFIIIITSKHRMSSVTSSVQVYRQQFRCISPMQATWSVPHLLDLIIVI